PMYPTHRNRKVVPPPHSGFPLHQAVESSAGTLRRLRTSDHDIGLSDRRIESNRCPKTASLHEELSNDTLAAAVLAARQLPMRWTVSGFPECIFSRGCISRVPSESGTVSCLYTTILPIDIDHAYIVSAPSQGLNS